MWLMRKHRPIAVGVDHDVWNCSHSTLAVLFPGDVTSCRLSKGFVGICTQVLSPYRDVSAFIDIDDACRWFFRTRA